MEKIYFISIRYTLSRILLVVYCIFYTEQNIAAKKGEKVLLAKIFGENKDTDTQFAVSREISFVSLRIKSQ
jgi:hypothetical protein